MVNPMLVEGQIRGGVVQGIGTALFEEIPYDEAGQPLAGTLGDYLMPGAAEMPAIKIGHLHTPTPHTEYGMKGMGEGGAVAPPAAIANALRHALSASGAAWGTEVNGTPITPRRVMAAIRKANAAMRRRRGALRRGLRGGAARVGDEQWVDPLRQSVHAQMRDLGDLGDRPNPKAVLSVSLWRTEIRAGLMPSSSAATCDSAVSRPWPCDWIPTISTTLPSVRMRAVQLSKPGMIEAPRAANSAAPCAVCLAKLVLILYPKWVHAIFWYADYRPADASTVRRVSRRAPGPASAQGGARCLVRRGAEGEMGEHRRCQTALRFCEHRRERPDRVQHTRQRISVGGCGRFREGIVWIKWLGTHRDYDRIDVREVNLE